MELDRARVEVACIFAELGGVGEGVELPDCGGFGEVGFLLGGGVGGILSCSTPTDEERGG